MTRFFFDDLRPSRGVRTTFSEQSTSLLSCLATANHQLRKLAKVAALSTRPETICFSPGACRRFGQVERCAHQWNVGGRPRQKPKPPLKLGRKGQARRERI